MNTNLFDVAALKAQNDTQPAAAPATPATPATPAAEGGSAGAAAPSPAAAEGNIPPATASPPPSPVTPSSSNNEQAVTEKGATINQPAAGTPKPDSGDKDKGAPASPSATQPAGTAPGAESGVVDDPVAQALAEQERKFLERFGVKSIEELEQRAKPKTELTPEQRQQEADAHKAKAINFAIERGAIKMKDFEEAQRIKNQSDQDLVMPLYVKRWIALNGEKPQFKGQNLQEVAEERFRRFFHLAGNDSEDPVTQDLTEEGQLSLKEIADDIKAQHDGKVSSAIDAYDNYLIEQQEITQFSQALDAIVGPAIPKQLVYSFKQDGQAEPFTFTFEVSGVSADEIKKALNNPMNRQFYKDHPDMAPKAYSEQIQNYLKLKFDEGRLQAAYNSGLSKGIDLAKVGTTAPFQLTPAGTPAVAENKDGISAADEAKIKMVHEKI